MPQDVSQRLLRDAKQGQTRVPGESRGRVGEAQLDRKAGHALHLFGELGERDGDACLLDRRRMQPVRELSQRVGQILDLVPDAVQMPQPGRVEPVARAAKLIQLVLHHDETLNRVVMNFPRDAGALFLVRLEKALGVAAVHGDQPALGDDHGYA